MLNENDIAACLEIYNWYIANSTATFETETLTLEEFSERVHRVQEKYPWIVAVENGRVTGYAYLSAFNIRKAYDWTCDLAIYVDHRCLHDGIGSQLMEVILECAEQAGFVSMMSLITEGNTASERLHEKFGFVQKASFHEIGYKNSVWLGVSFYEKKLNEPAASPKDPFSV